MLDSLIEKLQPVIGFFGDYPYVKALIVFLMTLAVANLVTMMVSKILLRLAHKTNNTLDNRIITLLHRPLLWTVILIGSLAAVNLLELPTNAYGIASSLVSSVLIFFWSLFVMQLLRSILRTLSHSNREQSLIRNQTLPLFDNLVIIVVVTITVYLLFEAWGIDMTAWIASAGIVGIAVGFAAKDTLANLFSGVFIMADAPYKIGDYIVLDSGQRGRVTHIGIRSTRLLTRGDVEITIPNAVIGNSSIINESGGPHEKFRIEIKVGVAYGSDIDKVREILMEIGSSETNVCDEPEHRVRFRAFGESSLDFELLCWVENPELKGRTIDALNSAIYKRFIAENIEIPFPQRDLYIKQMPAQGN
ncbi:MAG: mechanosensitive ion channel family protein [Gammaproteobacteria bacterium]|nr:mechanosensitive ion channel family protein [Gammaproteobacteria bacterium]